MTLTDRRTSNCGYILYERPSRPVNWTRYNYDRDRLLVVGPQPAKLGESPWLAIRGILETARMVSFGHRIDPEEGDPFEKSTHASTLF